MSHMVALCHPFWVNLHDNDIRTNRDLKSTPLALIIKGGGERDEKKPEHPLPSKDPIAKESLQIAECTRSPPLGLA